MSKFIIYETEKGIARASITEKRAIEDVIPEVVPDGVGYWILDGEDDSGIDFRIAELDISALGESGSVHTSLDGKVKIKKDKKDKKDKKEIKRIAKQYMDEQAKGQDYESIIDLCSHISSGDSDTIAEAQAGIDFRDNVKSHTKQLIKDIKNEVAEVPTEEELKAALPVIMWP